MAADKMIASDQPVKKSYFKDLIIFALLVLGVGAYWYLNTMGTPAATSKALDDKVAVMDVRLQSAETTIALYADRLTKLEKDVARASAASPVVTTDHTPQNPVPVPPPEIGATTPAAPPETAPAEDSKRLEALEKEIAALKTSAPLQDGEHIAHAIKLLSSYHRLSDKVLSGKPFSDELSSFEDEVGDTASQNKSLSQLASYAETGVPTQAELIAAFDNGVDQLNTTRAIPPAEAGPWDRFMFNLAHLVRIRRIDEIQTGKDVDSIIGRASAHLDKNEIEAAYAEVNSLPENIRPDFTGWMEDAQIAIDTPGIIGQLEEQVMQQVFSAPAAAKEAAPVPVIDKGIGVQ